MNRLQYMVCVLCLMGFCSCGTYYTYLSIDDAYHWSEKSTPTISSSSTSSHSSASSAGSSGSAISPAPSLEYTNIQDTTITVKIKR